MQNQIEHRLMGRNVDARYTVAGFAHSCAKQSILGKLKLVHKVISYCATSKNIYLSLAQKV